MNDEPDFLDPEAWDDFEITSVEPVVDHYGGVKRAASIVGDLRKALREEGFTREETFALVSVYWASEMGLPL
ncbi:hypothetical protein [Streptomyces sp. STCH 565 A]|uniref:DUF7187 family protein n=1 Tax=Streptomyces sp. STCH 565 A TaxID=2950532 RepID=UPI0006B977D2|nr:hypothetical protein [Streptomyces sp. STCH 565 A]KPC89325.1 hypothetical protein ADL35_02500 [Streptomyces sp. NRRL WC-3753]MCM8548798.1 hypothetical protein [Streptomyces sp. STCH 565 A]